MSPSLTLPPLSGGMGVCVFPELIKVVLGMICIKKSISLRVEFKSEEKAVRPRAGVKSGFIMNREFGYDQNKCNSLGIKFYGQRSFK